MILGFDIGNTNTLMGLYEGAGAVPRATYRFRTERSVTTDELGLMVSGFLRLSQDNGGVLPPVEGLAFSSVVPEVNGVYHRMSRKFFRRDALEITGRSRLSIALNYDNPDQLGADRIVNAEAACREYGGDCLIIDLGTAVTYCVLLDGSRFDGGIIGPGAGTAIEALAGKTSKLMRVSFQKPPSLIARNTVDAITSGFFYGWVSMVEGMIRRINEFYQRNFFILITGGFCDIIGDNIAIENTVDPLLTMKGIRYIYDLNRE